MKFYTLVSILAEEHPGDEFSLEEVLERPSTLFTRDRVSEDELLDPALAGKIGMSIGLANHRAILSKREK